MLLELLYYGVYLKYLYQLQEWVFYIQTNKDTHLNIMLTKHTLCHKHFFKNKNISKKLKWRLKNIIIDKTLTYASEAWIITKRDRKQINIFERKVYRRILGPVYENEKENWRILTKKEIYAMVKKPTIIETVKLNRLCWFGHVQRMEENKIPKNILYMNLETLRLRGRPRSRWQDEVREDGRIVGGKGYIIERNGRSSWEWHGIVAFCTCQWNEWMI